MAQSSINWSDPDFEESDAETQAMPNAAEDRDSDSVRSPNFQLASQSDPVADAARSADATHANSDANSDTNSASHSGADPDTDSGGQSPGESDASNRSDGSDQSDQSDSSEKPAPAHPPAQSSPSQVAPAPPDAAPSGEAGESPARPDADHAPAPRPRVRQIGQIPPVQEPLIYHQRYVDPEMEAQAQAQGQQMAAQQMQQDTLAQRQQIAQINGSDPYQDPDDGRWKKQLVDPNTGAINEHDILDNGMGKIDRGTGNIYAQTSQGPVQIGVDAPTQATAQLVNQRALLAAQGSQEQASITAAKGQLLAAAQQIAQFNGVPLNLERQITALSAGLSATPSDDPDTQVAQTTARMRLAAKQAELAQWKQANPDYALLTRQRDDLQASIQQQTADYQASQAAISQNLASQAYVKINGTLPPDPDVSGDTPRQARGLELVETAPSDVSLRAIQVRSAELAAASNLPPGVATAAALVEAKNKGYQTIGGIPVDDSLQSANAAQFAPQMTVPQLRAAVQAGVFTTRQAMQAAQAQRDAVAQAQATADNGVGAVQDFALRAVSKFSSVINHAGEGLSRWAAQLAGDKPTQDNDSAGLAGVNNFADLAQYFKGNADDVDAIDNGQGGLTNPSKNKSIGAGVADAVGFMGALAAGTTALAPLLPEIGLTEGGIGGLAAAGRWVRLGVASYKMLPALAVMAPMASAETYDQAKAKGASDVEATTQGMIAAAKQIPMIAAYAVGGKLAGALESKLLPGVITPVARGAMRLVTGAAANVGASTALRAGENAVAALGVPGMQAQPVMPDRDNLVSDLAFAGHGAMEAAVHEAGLPRIIETAQDIVAGSDPVHQALVKSSQDAGTPPGLAQKYAARAAQMQADAAAFLKQHNAPTIPPGARNDPLAQSIVDLHSQAADLRAKIQTAHDSGDPDAAGQIATHQQALSDTEDQLHAASQQMLARAPAELQARIAKAAAPGVDWDAAQAKSAESPVAHFAQGEIGAALKDQYVSPDKQRAIRQMARANGVDPDVAEHIANQAVGAKAIGDLKNVLLKQPIEAGKARALRSIGLLEPSNAKDPASPLNVTEDATHLFPPGVQKAVKLRPDALRTSQSPDSAHGAVLYSLAKGGMQHMADTAERMIPAKIAPEAAASAGSDADTSETDANRPENTGGSQGPRASAIPGLEDLEDARSSTENQRESDGAPRVKTEAGADVGTPNNPVFIRGRTPGKSFQHYDALRRLLKKHNVRLSVDPPFLRDDAPPFPGGARKGPAAFQALPGGKAMFYIRSDATNYEVLHELGHFVDWLKQGKPEDQSTLSEQAAYDFLRNNKARWRSLSDAEQQHANLYLIKNHGTPNLRKHN